ncbi:phosphatase PAP2 family protein [Arthrobacter sp. RIT-PI-e]|uniref:phosphatase PAP2 family protein n=1 Tax=Arthrobacter sp. RIT-PI-e TaxID=1681197 RepID=UPI000A3E8636|nr:phosphatase PAP2 family protein [Arthrobacter sp. RIT-PI-e]
MSPPVTIRPHRRWSAPLARVISELCAPAVLVTVFILIAALGGTRGPVSALHAGTAVVFTTLVPLGGVLLLVRRGVLVDHHLSDRAQRAPVLAATLVSISVGIVLLVLLDAPWRVTGTVLCTVAGVVVVLVVNLWWKLSAHSAVAAFVTVGCISLIGPGAWTLTVMAFAVGWSRVRLGAHTPAQVVAGYAVGTLIGSGFAIFIP